MQIIKGAKDGDIGKRKRPALPLRRPTQQQPQEHQKGSSSDPIIISSWPSPNAHREIPHTLKTATHGNSSAMTALPLRLPSKLVGLSKEEVKLLQYKQKRLKSSTSQAHQLHEYCNPKSDEYESLRLAVDATLVFAQEEAGTAVCISKEGLLLTCSHCVAESEEDLDFSKTWWLLFSDGRIIQARIVRWDSKRDLALLQIIAAQDAPSKSSRTVREQAQHVQVSFPYIPLAVSEPTKGTNLLCIGHPGSEDLEATRPGIATGYDVVHISEGKFRGYSKGQDRIDNSEIGALMHDCWTYWGHSGAPLVERRQGERGGGGLVGLHSSWDDETGMRRGVGWEALKGFLEEVDKDDRTVG